MTTDSPAPTFAIIEVVPSLPPNATPAQWAAAFYAARNRKPRRLDLPPDPDGGRDAGHAERT